MSSQSVPLNPAERVRALTAELGDALIELAAQASTQPEPVYDSRETARLLKVSKNTLIRLRQSGRIHPIRVGDRVLFTASELRRFMAQDGEEPAP